MLERSIGYRYEHVGFSRDVISFYIILQQTIISFLTKHIFKTAVQVRYFYIINNLWTMFIEFNVDRYTVDIESKVFV